MPVTTKNRVQKTTGRFYEIDGALLPSVTNILGVINKPALMNWAAKVEREMVCAVSADLYAHTLDMKKTLAANQWNEKLILALGQAKASQKILLKASEIGSEAHKLIEWQINAWMNVAGERPAVQEKALWAFMAWEDWAKSVHLKPIASEQVIWSRTHGYAGTLDLLAEVNGELSVLDWKTGKGVYAEAHLQNAAYRHAVREMGHGNPVKGYIVRLPKNIEDPAFEVVEAQDETKSLEAFLHAMKLWEWAQVQEEAYQAKKEGALSQH